MRTIIATAILLAIAGTAAAVQPTPDAPEKSADPRGKMICKKFLETGSLVRGTRVCKTKREWDHAREDLRQLSVTDSCRNSGQTGGCY